MLLKGFAFKKSNYIILKGNKQQEIVRLGFLQKIPNFFLKPGDLKNVNARETLLTLTSALHYWKGQETARNCTVSITPKIIRKIPNSLKTEDIKNA